MSHCTQCANFTQEHYAPHTFDPPFAPVDPLGSRAEHWHGSQDPEVPSLSCLPVSLVPQEGFRRAILLFRKNSLQNRVHGSRNPLLEAILQSGTNPSFPTLLYSLVKQHPEEMAKILDVPGEVPSSTGEKFMMTPWLVLIMHFSLFSIDPCEWGEMLTACLFIVPFSTWDAYFQSQGSSPTTQLTAFISDRSWQEKTRMEAARVLWWVMTYGAHLQVNVHTPHSHGKTIFQTLTDSFNVETHPVLRFLHEKILGAAIYRDKQRNLDTFSSGTSCMRSSSG
eukprot:gb/GECG01014429.1/.p1 GENE.gb/GECG01014429.1/~~gb/GECG01014429.1/.p1  ORF type:complete len:280 (+),score=11.88 gb/GECG01014429.1/:1-840(+)